jgi:hypothetical protein
MRRSINTQAVAGLALLGSAFSAAGPAQALAAYLKSLKPVRHQVPAIPGPSEKPTAPYLTAVMPQ